MKSGVSVKVVLGFTRNKICHIEGGVRFEACTKMATDLR